MGTKREFFIGISIAILILFCMPAVGPLLGKFLDSAEAFWKTMGIIK